MKNLRYLPLVLILSATPVRAQFTNIMISDQSYPEEPSIMINPDNTHQIVAGANISYYYYSGDGGLTWTRGELSSTFGVWGDPCIIVDTAGHFYFFHLSNPQSGNWIDRIVCQKTTDGGQTWNNGSHMGLNGNKAQDKEWAAVDRSNNYLYCTWTQFDTYGSSDPSDSTIIRFSRSENGGLSWSNAVRISKIAGDCLDGDNTVEGAVPSVGPNGEVYTSWAGPLGIVFTKSLNQGETWPEDNVFVSDMPGGWDFAIPGIYRANGQPVTCTDLSGGPYHGRIYINWSDQRNGQDDTDIWMVRSDDGGETWSGIIRVNDDPPGKQQFFTWMTVDQSTGFLYVVFYDRRNYTTSLTDVYLAVSVDGGETFENILISENPFYPVSSVFFGDYTNISAHNGIVRPIWTRLDGKNLSIWTALIDSLYVGIPPEKETAGPIALEQNFPNPVHGETYFPYKIHTPMRVTLCVHDMYGREVASLVKDRFHESGKYVEQFNPSGWQLSPGMYYFSLTCGELALKRKMIVE